MNTFLGNLTWRFATKKFDSTKLVSSEDLQKILDAIRFAPSSYGLQPFHIYIVSDKSLQKKMKGKSYMQSQVAYASHVLVFCARVDVIKRVSEYSALIRRQNILDSVKIGAMKIMMRKSINSKSEAGRRAWAAKQAYIALGFAMAACAELKIDSCPMEGFDPKGIDSVLKLPKTLESVLLLPIGYRSEGPSREKIRFEEKDLFTRI